MEMERKEGAATMTPLVFDSSTNNVSNNVYIDKELIEKASRADSATGIRPCDEHEISLHQVSKTNVPQLNTDSIHQQQPASISEPQVPNHGYPGWYPHYYNPMYQQNYHYYYCNYPQMNYDRNPYQSLHVYPQVLPPTAVQQHNRYLSARASNDEKEAHSGKKVVVDVDANENLIPTQPQLPPSNALRPSTSPTTTLPNSPKEIQQYSQNRAVAVGQPIHSSPTPLQQQRKRRRDDDDETFVLVKIPDGCLPGDTITFTVPNSNNSEVSIVEGKTDHENNQRQKSEHILAVVVPPLMNLPNHSLSSNLSQGSTASNQYILVNTSTFKQSRLTIDSFKGIDSDFPPCSPTRKSPQVVVRRPPFFRLASANDEWKKNRNNYPHKSSHVGKKYQALDIPEIDDFRRTDRDVCNTSIHDLIYDPKNPPDTLPSMLQNSTYIWTDNQREKFHLFMVRSMKNISCVNKMLGSIGLGNCLDYYYGVYKGTKEYALLKELCPKHFVEDVLCGICRKPKAVVACDTCTDAYHLGCLTPPLLEIPLVDHFECSICLKEKEVESSSVRAVADLLYDKSNTSSEEEEGPFTSSNSSGSCKSIFLSKLIESGKDTLPIKSEDQNNARRSSRPRRTSRKLSEKSCLTTPSSREKSMLEKLPKSYEAVVPDRLRHLRRGQSSPLKTTSIARELSTEDAKLGVPISMSSKKCFAFYETLHVINPIEGAIPTLWAISVGDTVSIRIEGSEMKDDVLSHLGIAQVTAICREVSKEEACELRRHMQPRHHGCAKDTTFSEVIDKQNISLEIRWFYRRSEIPDFDNIDSTVDSSMPNANELEEVYETDHMDVCDLSCVVGPVTIKTDETSSPTSPFKEANIPPSASLCCKRFYFVVRKKLSPPPKHLGESQLHRALNFSRIMKQSSNLKALIVDILRKKVNTCSGKANL